MIQTFHFDVPESAGLSERELKLTLAARLYELGKLSLGQSAEMAGVSKRAFIELLGAYGVSVFNLSADELGRDFDHA